MWHKVWMLYWLSEAILIGLALPAAAIGVTIDHRRHRHWPSTRLAMVWCLLALAIVGTLQGSLSPPLFGLALALLYALAWSRSRLLFTVGVAGYYCLTALVVIVAARTHPGDVNWWLLLSWPTSFAALIFWRTGRPPVKAASSRGSS